MRRAEKERLKEGEAADEELKKIKKESKKKGTSTTSKAAAPKAAVTKKKNKHFDEDHSPEHSQADENEQEASDDDDDIQWQTDTSLEAAKQRIQEHLSAVTADMVMLSTEEEKKKSVKKAPEHDIKVPEKVVSVHEKLVNQIKEHLKKGSSPTQLKSCVGSLSGGAQEIMDALFSALFDDVGKGFPKEVTKMKNYLAAATAAAAAKEEGWQMMLLHSIELFCGKASPVAAKEVALVIKVLYDDDILEEEFIMEWYKKGLTGSNKSSQIWKDVKPFIEWLQNAESEEE